MPLSKQLEVELTASPYRAASIISGQALRLAPVMEATEAVAIQKGRDSTLEKQARALLQDLGASALAKSVCVEWNPRMRSTAGRADYRKNVVALNPAIRTHEREIDRTLRHELSHLLAHARAGRKRIAPHGPEWRRACADLGIPDEQRCHAMPLPTRTLRKHFLYRCANCGITFPRVRKIRRTVACLACCREHNRGRFDRRFKLRLIKNALD